MRRWSERPCLPAAIAQLFNFNPHSSPGPRSLERTLRIVRRQMWSVVCSAASADAEYPLTRDWV